MPRELPPCPSTPNCVSTRADPSDAQHHMEPIPFEGDAESAIRAIEDVLASHPRTRIVERGADHITAECTTRIMRFTDDVEFVVDAEAGRIDFRSASRVGSSDLGKNRKRMTELSDLLRRRLGS